jgi:hypothetical protein
VRLAAPPDDHQQVPTHVIGLVVSPHTRSAYLGYERRNVNSPRLLARIVRWRHRGTFLAGSQDVARIDMNCVTLRSDYRRSPPGSGGRRAVRFSATRLGEA